MLNQKKMYENKKCRYCESIFEITNIDLEFYEKV